MSSVMSNPAVTNTDRSRESRRRRKKKSLAMSLHQTHNTTADHHQNPNQMIDNNRWRTATEQQKYSSKLLQALRHVRTPPVPAASVPRRGRAIREAADRVLAVSAKGRTRWSRAILTNKLKLKFLKAKKAKMISPIGMGTSRARKAKVGLMRVKAKNLPAVQKKAVVLGNLVPGCRKQPLAVVLEEAHDYISALEMQVRAMTALAELLSVAGALSNSPPPRPAP
ncbi:unnamed protein product [Rhodiola kirilowii]